MDISWRVFAPTSLNVEVNSVIVLNYAKLVFYMFNKTRETEIVGINKI